VNIEDLPVNHGLLKIIDFRVNEKKAI